MGVGVSSQDLRLIALFQKWRLCIPAHVATETLTAIILF